MITTSFRRGVHVFCGPALRPARCRMPHPPLYAPPPALCPAPCPTPRAQRPALNAPRPAMFQSIELPLQRTDSPSHSASTVSTTTSSPSAPSPSSALPPLIRGPPQPLCGTGYTHPHANHHHLHRMHYLTRPDASSAAPAPPDVWVLGPRKAGGKPASGGGGGGAVDLADYSYVQFAKDRPSVHEYSTLDRPADGKGMTAAVAAAAAAAARRDSVGSLKRHHVDTALLGSAQPALPTQSKGRRPAGRHRLSRRSRCMYCREMFVHDENARGSCADAPDRGADCVRRLACLCAADSVLYHCTADADGEYADPCTCDRRDDGNWTRWLALTALSVFVPCLLCYWPLTACYRCAVACHCCGGRHKAT